MQPNSKLGVIEEIRAAGGHAQVSHGLDCALAGAVQIRETIMPTHESQLPRMPVLPWQRPPVSRNPKGQFRPGASGNPRGRPTNARLAAKRAALGDLAILKRAASYEGMTPEQFVRVARAAYGKSWRIPLAADLIMSVRGVARWAKGQCKISLENEILILMVCLRRVRRSLALVRAMYRVANRAERARQKLAALPRYKPLTPRGRSRAV